MHLARTLVLRAVRIAALVALLWAASGTQAHAQYGYYRFPVPGGYGIAASYPGAYTVGTYTPFYNGYYSGYAGGYGYGLAGNYGYGYGYPNMPGYMAPPFLYRNFGGFVYPNTPGMGAVGYGGFGYPYFSPYFQYYGVGPGYSMYQSFLW